MRRRRIPWAGAFECPVGFRYGPIKPFGRDVEDRVAMLPNVQNPPAAATAQAAASDPRSLRELRFPFLYGGIVVAGSFDIWLTGLLLSLGGREANPVAGAVLETHGFTGMVIFKYLVVATVILACEFVASRDRRKARFLAITLVALHAAPLPWSASLLAGAL